MILLNKWCTTKYANTLLCLLPLTMAQPQAGIGTYTATQIATPTGAKLSKTIDMMVGKHLDAHVIRR